MSAIAPTDAVLPQRNSHPALNPAPAPDVASLDADIHALIGDEEFSRYQSRSLAVFAAPTAVRTFHLAVEVSPDVVACDRFRIGQLLQAVTFPRKAYVLTLSENTARLIEIGTGHRAPSTPLDCRQTPTRWCPRGGRQSRHAEAAGPATVTTSGPR